MILMLGTIQANRSSKRALGGLQHVGDGRAVGLGEHPPHDRLEPRADLGAGRHADPVLLGILLEVGGTDRHLGEPPPQRVVVDLGQSQHQRQAAYRDRLEVLGHQVGAASVEDAAEVVVHQRRDHRYRPLLDLAGPKRRVERAPQRLLLGPVDQQDVALPHGAVKRRGGDAGREGVRVAGCLLDGLPGRGQPQPHARHPRDRGVLAQPGVDGVGILVQLLHGDRRQPCLCLTDCHRRYPNRPAADRPDHPGQNAGPSRGRWRRRRGRAERGRPRS